MDGMAMHHFRIHRTDHLKFLAAFNQSWSYPVPALGNRKKAAFSPGNSAA